MQLMDPPREWLVSHHSDDRFIVICPSILGWWHARGHHPCRASIRIQIIMWGLPYAIRLMMKIKCRSRCTLQYLLDIHFAGYYGLRKDVCDESFSAVYLSRWRRNIGSISVSCRLNRAIRSCSDYQPPSWNYWDMNQRASQGIRKWTPRHGFRQVSNLLYFLLVSSVRNAVIHVHANDCLELVSLSKLA